MKKTATLALALGLTFATAAGGQDKKTTDVSVEGHVYEHAKLEPSDGLVGTYQRRP